MRWLNTKQRKSNMKKKRVSKDKATTEREHVALRAAFCHAAAAGETIVVEKLLEAGVDLSECFDALERAAENGRTETLKLLLPKFDNLSEATRAFRAAAGNDHLEAAREILAWIDTKTGKSTPDAVDSSHHPAP
jgi:ankyrin repeat protein